MRELTLKEEIFILCMVAVVAYLVKMCTHMCAGAIH